MAIWSSSWREYLWLLSVQMVSPSLKETARSAPGIATVCLRFDRRCISMLRASGLKRATCSNCCRSKSASSSRLMRASRFRLKARINRELDADFDLQQFEHVEFPINACLQSEPAGTH